jgi:bifunctional DNase/RNase
VTVPDPVAEPIVSADPIAEPMASADPVAEVGSDLDGGAAAPQAAPVEAAPADAVGPEAVDFRLALVSSVTLDLPSQYPTVVLRELDTPRRQLTFSIGMPDAVALSHAFRRIPTPRPLTHELMSEVLQRFDIDVVAVRIVGRTGSIHFAELDLRGRNGRSVHSCRPSDALTVALHQPVQVPILIDARLLEGTGDVVPLGAADG